MAQQPEFAAGVWLSLIVTIFLIWTLIWMFKALKVSCNLKGYTLGILYTVDICGGEVVIRYLISMCY